jgi:hypothetical protein
MLTPIRPLLIAAVLNSGFLAATAWPQTTPRGLGVEVHAGYGGGGLHADALVGGGLGYHLGPRFEATGFLSALAARPEGRVVFAGLGLRVAPLGGMIRPYLEAGPLLRKRSYAADHVGTFGHIGLEAALERRPRPWRVFVEGRVMGGGGSWTQVVGGVRYR